MMGCPICRYFLRYNSLVDIHPPPGLPPFQLQAASLRDLGELRALEQECFGRDAWPLLDLISVLAFPGVVRIKAVVGSVMAGFVAGESKPLERAGWITTIGVSGRFRRKGIGFALLSACEAELHAPTMRLCVRKSNLAAQRMYQKAGYTSSAVWARYYSDGEDALVLQKNLPDD